MARFWTSPNSCAYVPDYVFITVQFPQPVPEPDFDVLTADLIKTARNFAIDEGGPIGRRYRLDEDDMICEDNPTVIIDGLQYVTYTGNVKIMCYCEHGDAENLENEIAYLIKDVNGKIIDTEIIGDY